MAKAQNLQQAIANMLRNIEQDEAVSAYSENLDNLFGYLYLDITRQKPLNNGKCFLATEQMLDFLQAMRNDAKLFFGTLDAPNKDFDICRALFDRRKEQLKQLLLDLRATLD